MAAVFLSDSVLRDLDAAILAVLVVLASVIWAAVLATVFARGLADELSAMVALAERGRDDAGNLDAAHRQLVTALDERNRQIHALARETGAISIDDEPRHVVRSVVSATRSVMADPTWRCAVVRSDDAALLPVGVYFGAEEAVEPTAVTDLEQWAAVAATEGSASRVEGPWGAFAVVPLGPGGLVRGALIAPWEGRPSPTPAETALMTLVGQHASAALDHSILYARVRAQADDLDRLASVQADFLRGVTHDLQTPLTRIGALATELRAEGGLSDSVRADLDTITHQADRLRRMVAQLLVASRLGAGAISPRQDVFAVTPLIERTWHALRADRELALSTEGLPHLAIGDPDRLEQVLWAVLDNAVKYSPSGSGITVRVGTAAGRMEIAVRDEGVGMDAATRELVFDQFYRAPEAQRLAPDGSGVGLYAARGLMEAMEGSIDVRSAPGKGTLVVMSLPAEAASDPDA